MKTILLLFCLGLTGCVLNARRVAAEQEETVIREEAKRFHE